MVDLRLRHDSSSQSMVVAQTWNPRASALLDFPPCHDPDRASAAELMTTTSQPSVQHTPDVLDAVRLEHEGTVRTQNPTPGNRQRSVQLGELISHITTLREQLGLDSDVTTVERDRVLHSQLTSILNTLQLPHEQGVTTSREDDRSQIPRVIHGK